MPDISPPRDPERLPQIAERLRQQFAETAEQHDREASFPYENLAALKDAGIYRLLLPVDRGGWGADLAQSARFMRTIAAGDASTALILTQHFAVSGAFTVWAARSARIDRFIGEDLAHDAFVPLFTGAPEYEDRSWTLARQVDGGVVLSGRKGFGTGGRIADWAVSQATLPDHPAGSQAILVIYRFQQPAVRVIQTWDTFGMRSTLSDDFIFDDLFVPADDIIAQAPAGVLRPGSGPGTIYSALVPFGNTYFSATYLGIADAALAYTREMVRIRTSLGQSEPMGSNPAVQSALGEIELLWREISAVFEWTIGRHRNLDPDDPDLTPDIAVLKDSVTHRAVAIVDACWSLLGGMAYFRRSPIERHYRDVRAGPIHPLNHQAVVALLGRKAVEG